MNNMNNMRKTKIICTLGPATDDDNVLRALMESGMDVARFNFSHATHESAQKTFDRVKRIREELGLPVAALVDTKGPEIRTGKMKDDAKIELVKGEKITLTTKDMLGTKDMISITYAQLPNDIEDGGSILIDDGLIELEILSHTATEIHCKILNDGVVSNNKGINVPGVCLTMPYLSEKDRGDILYGAEAGFDFVAASFARNGKDIQEVRDLILGSKNPHMKIIAKIENQEGLDNIDDILRLSDGIMVARGDMGVEIPFAELPAIQKMLIKKGYKAGKQVITATQMLDSMQKNPRPTRAETTDVANAIYDGTSAIMLSGETANGKYPVESLQTMVNIALHTEANINYNKRFKQTELDPTPTITNAISHATVTTSIELNASAIVTVTKTGSTARMISKYRPSTRIVCGCMSEQVCRQMNLSWGVSPILCEEKHSEDDLFNHAIEQAEKHGFVKSGDLAVLTAGVPLGVSGTTNMMKVHVVGDVLVKGEGITNKRVVAKVCVCENEDDARKNFKAGEILVIKKATNNILDLIKTAAGVITEEAGADSTAATAGLTLDIPVLVGADEATSRLRSGVVVALDAEHSVVCNMNNKI